MTQSLQRLILKIFPGEIQSEAPGKTYYFPLNLLPAHPGNGAGDVIFFKDGSKWHVMLSAFDLRCQTQASKITSDNFITDFVANTGPWLRNRYFCYLTLMEP